MSAPTFVPQLIAEADGLFPAQFFLGNNLPERVGRGLCLCSVLHGDGLHTGLFFFTFKFS